MDLLSQLLQLERGFWTEGPEYYRDHLAPDCLMALPGVGFMTREAAIRGIEGGQRWERLEVAEPQLVRLGEDAALLAYSAEAQRSGREQPYRSMVSSVYVKLEGSWRLAFHQQSPL